MGMLARATTRRWLRDRCRDWACAIDAPSGSKASASTRHAGRARVAAACQTLRGHVPTNRARIASACSVTPSGREARVLANHQQPLRYGARRGGWCCHRSTDAPPTTWGLRAVAGSNRLCTRHPSAGRPICIGRASRTRRRNISCAEAPPMSSLVLDDGEAGERHAHAEGGVQPASLVRGDPVVAKLLGYDEQHFAPPPGKDVPRAGVTGTLAHLVEYGSGPVIGPGPDPYSTRSASAPATPEPGTPGPARSRGPVRPVEAVRP